MVGLCAKPYGYRPSAECIVWHISESYADQGFEVECHDVVERALTDRRYRKADFADASDCLVAPPMPVAHGPSTFDRKAGESRCRAWNSSLEPRRPASSHPTSAAKMPTCRSGRRRSTSSSGRRRCGPTSKCSSRRRRDAARRSTMCCSSGRPASARRRWRRSWRASSASISARPPGRSSPRRATLPRCSPTSKTATCCSSTRCIGSAPPSRKSSIRRWRISSST